MKDLPEVPEEKLVALEEMSTTVAVNGALLRQLIAQARRSLQRPQDNYELIRRLRDERDALLNSHPTAAHALIERLLAAERQVEDLQKDSGGVRPCCGQYTTCERPCTPRGRELYKLELEASKKEAG